MPEEAVSLSISPQSRRRRLRTTPIVQRPSPHDALRIMMCGAGKEDQAAA
jgi:hypothetical protein